MDVQQTLELLLALPPLWVWAILVLGSWIEYVFPPFPGDTVVVAGAALGGAAGWPVAPILLCTTAGAVLGAWMDWGIGRWLARDDRLERYLPDRPRRVVLDLVEQFERHGFVILAINRFMPGVRGLFFVAAGLGGLRAPPVLAAAAVAAMAWNGVLVGGGLLLGRNVETLASVVARYNAVVGGAVAAAVVAITVWAWRRAGPRQETS